MRHIPLLSLLALVGCSQSHGEPRLWRSGSRLRAIVERTDDGLARFVTWHDTELGIDCGFARDVDGALRCLPRAVFQAGFLDAACSTVGHRAYPCAPVPQRLLSRVVPPSGPCPAELTNEVVEIDLDAASEISFDMLAGACSASATPTRVHPIVATVDPSRFVAASIELRAVTARASVEVIVAEDGSEETSRRIHDAELDLECHLWNIGASAPCVPTRAASVSPFGSTPVFSDASCSVPLAAFAGAGCDEEPPLAISSGGDACEPVAFHEVGAPHTGPTGTRQADGTCAETTSAWATYYELGPRFDASRLVQGELGTRGDGEVRLRTLEVEGRVVSDVQFVDASDRPCWTGRFPDGSVRCARADIVLGSLFAFADPACTEPVLSWHPSSCDDADAPTRAAVQAPPTSTCGGVGLGLGLGGDLASVHDLTPIPPGPRYRIESGACVEMGVSDGTEQDYRLSAPLPIESLPRITRAME